MAEHHYKFNVTMTCGGCSGAVERVLKKLDGKKMSTHTHHNMTLLNTCYIPPHPKTASSQTDAAADAFRRSGRWVIVRFCVVFTSLPLHCLALLCIALPSFIHLAPLTTSQDLKEENASSI